MWHNFDRGRYWPSCTFLMTQLCNWRVSTWYWHSFPPIQGLLYKNAALSLIKWFRQRLVPSLPSRDWHSGQSEKKHNRGTTQCTRKTWNPQHYCTVKKTSKVMGCHGSHHITGHVSELCHNKSSVSCVSTFLCCQSQISQRRRVCATVRHARQ